MSDIAQKIANVMVALGTFAADKRNTQQNYEYISADQVLSRVGDAMAKEGLAVIPSVSGIDVNAVEWKSGYRYDVTAFMEIVIASGDESVPRLWVGIGSDYSSPDKALSKAITTGHKYFLMKLFNIGIGNPDGEHDEQPVKAAQKAPAGKPAQKPPMAKPQPETTNGHNEWSADFIGKVVADTPVLAGAGDVMAIIKSLDLTPPANAQQAKEAYTKIRAEAGRIADKQD